MAQQTLTYFLVFAGVMLLFHLGGLIEPSSTPNSLILNLLLDPGSIQSTSFATKALTVLGILVGVGVVVGAFISNSSTELIAVSPFAIFLFNFVFDALAIYNTIAAQNKVWALLLSAPIFAVIPLLVIDWWRRAE